MTDYAHLYRLKINEVSEDQFSGFDGESVEYIRTFWPDGGVPLPTVGWVFGLSSESNSELTGLLEDVDDEESHVGIEELDKFVKDEIRRQRISRLVATPAEREKLTQANLKIALDWLRLEPYSTVDVMALVLRKSEMATRRILNKFVEDGWLVRDKCDWTGAPGWKYLFGISSIGLYHLIDEGGYEPPPSRDFKKHRTKASGGAHILNLQLARLYCQRHSGVQNPDYRLARDLPHFQAQTADEQFYMWQTYPDAVFKYSHIKDDDGYSLSLAIEIEQHPKGTKRYRELIRKHLMNVELGAVEGISLNKRYDRVVYFLPDADKRDALKRNFHALIDRISVSKAEISKQVFLFDTYDDLVERIRQLG